MKKILVLLFVSAVILGLSTQAVFAGGDQVVGEKGQGEVVQNGPIPFGGETPAGPLN